MKFIFLIQGEGRGHLTQAITLFELLTNNGHKVCEVFVGKSKHRNIPAYFYSKIFSPITHIDSPNFFHDPENKGIKIFTSIIDNIIKTPTFLKNINKIKRSIKKHQADIFLNFYDLHGGLLYLFNKMKTKYYCIGHQYFFDHPSFNYPKNKKYISKILLKLHTKVTSIKADKKLALSFYKAAHHDVKKIFVMPPLLRNDLFQVNAIKEDYIMGYILNAGYAEDLIQWHNNNKQVKLHIFWDKKSDEKTNENIRFHTINDVKFVELLKACQGYFSTAGFESICEAFYLGKPVLLNPVKNHFEQDCNAHDAVKSGAGIIDSQFNISKLIEFIPIYKTNTEFKKWVDSSKSKFLEILTS
ncbi:glycosyltransferase family protein [Bacteroidota bacterium]